MKFSDETRAQQLESRIRKLMADEKQNWGLIRKAKRELAAIRGRQHEAQD